MYFIHGNVINWDISYEVDTWSRDLNTDFKWGYCLFGAVKLTANADIDKYRYIGYGTGFDSRSQLLWSDSSWG